MAIRGILFDKDGTLIDFPSTWTPVLQALALEFAKGDRARADDLMETAGYDPETGRFTPGSIWAAGNTPDLVTAWLPDAVDSERADVARWVDDYCERIAPDTAVPVTDLVQFFGACGNRAWLSEWPPTTSPARQSPPWSGSAWPTC
jgi:phosphoglycolate phosphatase